VLLDGGRPAVRSGFRVSDTSRAGV